MVEPDRDKHISNVVEFYEELLLLCNEKKPSMGITVNGVFLLFASILRQIVDCDGCSHRILSELSSAVLNRSKSNIGSCEGCVDNKSWILVECHDDKR